MCNSLKNNCKKNIQKGKKKRNLAQLFMKPALCQVLNYFLTLVQKKAHWYFGWEIIAP